MPIRHANPTRHPFPGSKEDLVVDGTVRVFLAVPADSWGALVRLEGGPVRLTLDGTNPAGGGPGIILFDGDEREMSLAELNSAKWIRDGAVNGTARAQYYLAR